MALRPLCERLFGKGVHPHSITIYGSDDFGRLSDPDNLRALRADGFGYAVFWEHAYTGRANPINKTYTYSEPEEVARAMAAARDYGFKIIGYVHGPKCRDAGMSVGDILDMIANFGWDGVMLDNGEVGRRGIWGIWETTGFFRSLKIMGMTIMHHSSVEPHFGRVDWRGPWSVYEDYRYQGETNIDPVDASDPKWRYVVSQATVGNIIGQFKPAKDSRLWDEPETWMPRMAELLCSPRTGFGTKTEWAGSLSAFRTYYLPRYRVNAAEYQADPEAYVERARKRLFGTKGAE